MTKYVLSFILQAIFLWSCGQSFIIYTSLMSESLPWYEPCGMQFLAILVITAPVMILVGIAQILFGKFVSISRVSKATPFVSAITLGGLVFLDGSIGAGMQITGAVLCAVAGLVSIVFYIIDMKTWRKVEIDSHS